MKCLYSFIRSAVGFAVILLSFNTWAGEIRIEIKSGSSPPLKNLVRNGGFEKGLEGWTIARSEDKGWEVKLSDESFSGAHSLYVKVADEDGRRRPRGAFQSLNKAMLDGLMAEGRTYYLSCRVKAIKASNTGGKYCGAGAVLAFFDADWKQSAGVHAREGDTAGEWKKLVSSPIKYEDWAKNTQVIANLAYSIGEMWIDDICISEVASLDVHVNGSPFRQVLIKGNDDILFDSGRLPGETTSFSKSIEGFCYDLFTVSVVGDDGTVVRKTLDLSIKEKQ